MTNYPGEFKDPFVYKSETAANKTSLLPAVRSLPTVRSAGLGRCPNCGAAILPGTSICPECGEFLRAKSKKIRCRRCGHNTSSILVICPHCGRDLMPAPSRLIVWGAPGLLVILFFGVLLGRWHNGNLITWTQNKVASGATWVKKLGDSMAPTINVSITQITPTPFTLLINPGNRNQPVSATAWQIASNEQSTLTQSVQSQNIPAPNAVLVVTNTVASPTIIPTMLVTPIPPVVDTPTAQPTATFTPLPTSPDTPTAINTPTALNTPTVTNTSIPSNTPATTPIAQPTAGRLMVLVATFTPTGVIPPLTTQPNLGPASQNSITPTNDANVTLTASAKTPKAMATLAPTQTSTQISTPTITPTSPTINSASIAQKTYEIRPGDTLGAIAVQFGVTNEALMAANSLTNEDIYRLRPGQSLIIPSTATTTTSAVATTPTARRTYVIRSGDTPLQIANVFGISATELLIANNLSTEDARRLRVGQVLIIPGNNQVADNGQAQPTATLQPTPQPTPQNTVKASVASASAQTQLRLDAPQLRSPENNAAISCNGNNALVWQSVPFMLDSDNFVLHLGFVNGHDTDGKETITWVLEQIQSPNNTTWNMDPGLCALAPQDLGRQWRWYVEVIDANREPVSLPSTFWGFNWN
jgi:LysM repeat protein